MKNKLKRLCEHLQARLAQVQEVAMPTWRVLLRERGKRIFNQRGLPTKRWERYRYTPLASRIAAVFADGWHELPHGGSPVVSPPVLQLPGHHIVLHNGVLQPLPTLPAGVSVKPLSQLSDEEHLSLAKKFSRFHQQEEDPWAALNASLFADGLLVIIKAGIRLTKPIFLHHHLHVDALTMSHPRLYYHLEAGAHADLVEIPHVRGGYTTLQNSVVRIALDDAATLRRHLWYDDLQADAMHVNHTGVVAATQSSFWESNIVAGEGFVRHALDVALVGKEAKTTLYGGYIGQGRGHTEHSSVVTHQVADTTSHTLYKGIVDGRSTGVFYSSERVGAEATGTKTSQYHHGWILDDRAHLYARPELFIHREEVACQHGATMEGVDPSQLFYLRARGISPSSATQMLLTAFLQAVIEPIPVEGLKDHVQQQLGVTLHGLKGVTNPNR